MKGGSLDVGGEVEWVGSHRCWGVTSRCLDVPSPLAVSFSLLFSLGVIHFEGKIKPEMVLHQRGFILQSTQKINFS